MEEGSLKLNSTYTIWKHNIWTGFSVKLWWLLLIPCDISSGPFVTFTPCLIYPVWFYFFMQNLGKLLEAFMLSSSALAKNKHPLLSPGWIIVSQLLLYRLPFTFMTHTHTQTQEKKIRALLFDIMGSYEFQLQSFFPLHSSHLDILLLLVRWPSWHPELMHFTILSVFIL